MKQPTQIIICMTLIVGQYPILHTASCLASQCNAQQWNKTILDIPISTGIIFAGAIIIMAHTRFKQHKETSKDAIALVAGFLLIIILITMAYAAGKTNLFGAFTLR